MLCSADVPSYVLSILDHFTALGSFQNASYPQVLSSTTGWRAVGPHLGETVIVVGLGEAMGLGHEMHLRR